MVYLAHPEPKDVQMLDVIPNGYLSAQNNLMDRPNHLICHLLSCRILPTTLSVPFLSILM